MKVTVEFSSFEEAAAALGVALADVSGAAPSEPTTGRKRGRKPKAEEPASPPPAEEPAPVIEDDPFAIESDEPEPEVKPATDVDVREALKNYQAAAKAKLLSSGTDAETASKTAMETARALLKKVGSSDTLGGLDKSKYDAVVKAAKDATAKL